jgi:hypothetical protein
MLRYNNEYLTGETSLSIVNSSQPHDCLNIAAANYGIDNADMLLGQQNGSFFWPTELFYG